MPVRCWWSRWWACVAMISDLLLAPGLQIPVGAGTTTPPFPMTPHRRRRTSSGAAHRDSSSASWQSIVASKSFTGTVWKTRIVPDCLAWFFCFLFVGFGLSLVFFLFVMLLLEIRRKSPQQLFYKCAAREGHGCLHME